MSVLYERIAALCKAKGLSNSKMCLEVGIQPSVMSDLKTGRKKGMNADTAHKIASYFDVSVGYILGNENTPATETGSRRSSQLNDFIDVLDSLSPEIQDRLIQVSTAYLIAEGHMRKNP